MCEIPDDYLKWIADLEASTQSENGACRLFGSGIAENIPLREKLLASEHASFSHHAHGSPELIAHIKSHCDPKGSTGEPVLAEGASGALLLVCFALLKSGGCALVECPGYQPLGGAVLHAGGRVQYVRRADAGWALSPSAIKFAARENPDTKLLIVTNPHNPSGALLSESSLKDIADALTSERPDAKLVVDEAFLDLVPEDIRPPYAATIDDRFISVSSLTKSYGLGWLRCGWVLAWRGLHRELALARRNDHQFGTDVLQMLSVRAFESLTEFRSAAEKILNTNCESMNELVLPLLQEGRLSGLLPSFGGLCFLGVPGVSDATEMVEALKERKLFVAPGSRFGSPRHFRLNYGASHSDVREGLNGLAQVIRGK